MLCEFDDGLLAHMHPVGNHIQYDQYCFSFKYTPVSDGEYTHSIEMLWESRKLVLRGELGKKKRGCDRLSKVNPTKRCAFSSLGRGQCSGHSQIITWEIDPCEDVGNPAFRYAANQRLNRLLRAYGADGMGKILIPMTGICVQSMPNLGPMFM